MGTSPVDCCACEFECACVRARMYVVGILAKALQRPLLAYTSTSLSSFSPTLVPAALSPHHCHYKHSSFCWPWPKELWIMQAQSVFDLLRSVQTSWVWPAWLIHFLLLQAGSSFPNPIPAATLMAASVPTLSLLTMLEMRNQNEGIQNGGEKTLVRVLQRAPDSSKYKIKPQRLKTA